jgi:protocatechuate 3,4-dioxygenase beta subunit
MAGGGRVLAVLGAVVVAAVAAGVWLVTHEPDAGDSGGAARDPDATDVDSPRPDREPPRKSGSRRHAKQTGTSGVLGVVKRREGSAPAAGQQVALVREGEEPWTAAADASGTFRFADLPDGGPYELRVESKGCATIRLPGLVLARDEQRDVGTLWLDQAVRVVVSVRTMSNEPVEGAEVEAYAAPDMAQGGADFARLWAQLAAAPVAVAKGATDKDGKAVFPEMASGTWTFSARKAGLGRDGRTNVRLVGGDTPPEVRIWLATGHVVRGRVLDGNRKPVPGALVMGGRSGNVWDFGAAALRARTSSDAEGRWELADLPTGDIALLAGRAGTVPFQAAVVRVPNVSQYDLYIRDGGRLEGTVTESASGKPVEGVTVRVQSWGQTNRVAEAKSDAEGKYAIDPVPEGTINDVTVSKEGWIHDRTDDPPFGRQMQIQPGDVAKRDLKLRRGASVRGVVTGPDGPVAGARVTVYTSGRDGNVQSAQPAFTDAEGKFVVAPVDKGPALVQASKEGLVLKGFPENWWSAVQQGNIPPQFRAEVPETGDAQITLKLERGQRVEGRVESPEGPLAGVVLTAYGSAGVQGTTKSRDDGSFVLEGVTPTQRLNVQTVKEGWLATRNEPVPVLADQPTTGVVLKMVRQRTVRGKVVSSGGQPLRDAQVMVVMRQAAGGPREMPVEVPVPMGPSGQQVAVGADGAYEAPIPWAEGRIAVRATALDHAPGESPPVQLNEGQEVYEANVVLEDGYAIRGRVASSGAAVPGADVMLSGRGGQPVPAEFGGNPGGGTVVAVTDAEGVFTIDHTATGTYSVTARAEGFVAKSATNVTVPTSGDVSIELDAAMEIEGRVAFSDATPVAGAIVAAQREETGTRINRSRGGWGGGGAQGITGPDGRFRIRGLAPGNYRLNVQAPWDGSANFRPKQSDPVSAGATDVKVFVDPGAVISGKVVDSRKNPVPGAQINANPSKPDGGNQWRFARSKADGSFEIAGLGDVPYHLNAQPPQGYTGAGLRPGSVQNVAVGARDVEIVLEEGLKIEGSIVDADGKPLSQAQLWIQPLPDAQGRQAQMNGNNMWTSTDADGAFRFVGLAPGNYNVMLQQWQGGKYDGLLLQGGSAIAAGTADVRLVATSGERIAGVVVDESGQPIFGAWVNAGSQTMPMQRSARSDKDGRFEITGLPAGTVRIDAGAPGRPGVHLEKVDTGTTVLRVVVPRGGTIAGRILDSGGGPWANQGLQFRQTEGGSNQGWTQTNAEGRFTSEPLAEGTYELSVWRAKPDGSGGEMVRIGAAKTGESVELRIP